MQFRKTLSSGLKFKIKYICFKIDIGFKIDTSIDFKINSGHLRFKINASILKSIKINQNQSKSMHYVCFRFSK